VSAILAPAGEIVPIGAPLAVLATLPSALHDVLPTDADDAVVQPTAPSTPASSDPKRAADQTQPPHTKSTSTSGASAHKSKSKSKSGLRTLLQSSPELQADVRGAMPRLDDEWADEDREPPKSKSPDGKSQSPAKET
jgi:hypothetical protein